MDWANEFGVGITLSTDVEGHVHRGKGPGGGQFVSTSKDGGTPDGSQPKSTEDGYKGSGTREDPARCGANIALAAKLLSEGKFVRLKQPEQVATLIDKMSEIVNSAMASGQTPPDFDLCKITVKNTNLFCQDNLDIPRVRMPQMRGIPLKGTLAAMLPAGKKSGKVDLTQQFLLHLKQQGIKASRTDIRASHLRASQNQIVGSRVMQLINETKAGQRDLREKPIFVTRDNYVVDGHHHWAAIVAYGYGRDKDMKVPVYQLDMDIGQALQMANDFTKAYGLAPKSGDTGQKVLSMWAEQVACDCLLAAGDDVEAGLLATEIFLSTQPFPDEMEVDPPESPDDDWREEADPIGTSDGKPVDLNVLLSFDIHNRQAQGILNRSLQAVKGLSAAAREDLIVALKKIATGSSDTILDFIDKYRVRLARVLTNTQLAALLEGAREVAVKVPPLGEVPVEGLSVKEQEKIVEARRNKPPPINVPRVGGGAPEDIHYVTIDEAVKNLQARDVMDRPTFDALEASARAKAFTVANVQAEETLTKIRDSLAKNVQEGADYETWRKKVLEDVDEGTFMSEPHQETVFRTNIQTAFSDGQAAVLSHPLVRSGFPYSAYDAIHDGRVRENHLALERLGINGTNIYRNDDPVFQVFRPPWDYNDRCGWTPMTVRQAAERGVKEAQIWLDTGMEPAVKAHVPMPNFAPPPEFKRSVLAAPLSIQLSLRPAAAFGFDPNEPRDESGKWTKLKRNPSEHGSTAYDLHVSGKQIGGITLVDTSRSGEIAEKARSAFPGITTSEDTFSSVDGVFIPKSQRGKGIGQLTYLLAFSQHDADWYFGSSMTADATNVYKSLAAKGFLEVHWEGGDEPDWNERGKKHIARLTDKGRKFATDKKDMLLSVAKPDDEPDSAELFGQTPEVGSIASATLDTAKEQTGRRMKVARAKTAKGKRIRRSLFKRLRIKKRWRPAPALSVDEGGRLHKGKGPGGGQFTGEHAQAVETMKRAHPFPPPRDITNEPPGLSRPDLVEKSAELQKALAERNAHTEAYNRAAAADTVLRLLTKSFKEVPVPTVGASEKRRIRNAKVAFNRLEEIVNSLQILKVFSKATKEIGESHAKGPKAVDAAIREAERRYPLARKNVMDHVAQLIGKAKELGDKKLDKLDEAFKTIYPSGEALSISDGVATDLVKRIGHHKAKRKAKRQKAKAALAVDVQSVTPEPPASDVDTVTKSDNSLPEVVGVLSDWDDMKAVVVGRSDNDVIPEWYPSFKPGDSNEVDDPSAAGKTKRDYDPEMARRAIEQTEALCRLLEKEGVQVFRPELLPIEVAKAEPVGLSQAWAREFFTVFGRKIVVNQPRTPHRNKDHQGLEKLFSAIEQARLATVHRLPACSLERNPDWRNDPRPFLEGGDVFRLGKDVIVTMSYLASSPAGYRWLAELLEPDGIEVWPAYLTEDWEHGDYIFMPVREGLCVAYQGGFVDGLLPSPITDWDCVALTHDEADNKFAANGVVLRENVLLLPSGCPRVVRALERKGVHVIELPFDGPMHWQGGIDCSMSELWRGDRGQAFSTDVQGLEHRGKGPGGGQFTSKGKGGAQTAKPEPSAKPSVVAKAKQAYDWAHHAGSLGFSKLPDPVQKVISEVLSVAFVGWNASRNLAERIALEKGATPEQAAKTRSVLAALDSMVFKPVAIATAGMGPVVAAASWVMPPVTAMYLIHSAAAHPMATYRAAKSAIRDVAGTAGATAELLSRAGLSQ